MQRSQSLAPRRAEALRNLLSQKKSSVRAVSRLLSTDEESQRKMLFRLRKFVAKKNPRLLPASTAIAIAKALGTNASDLYFELTPEEQTSLGDTPITDSSATPTTTEAKAGKKKRQKKDKEISKDSGERSPRRTSTGRTAVVSDQSPDGIALSVDVPALGIKFTDVISVSGSSLKGKIAKIERSSDGYEIVIRGKVPNDSLPTLLALFMTTRS